MAFRLINSDGRGFCVEPDDDADPLAQMFVGEADGVANERIPLAELAVAATEARELGRSQCQG